MICPILKAGAMITRIQTETNRSTIHDVYRESAQCMREKCEWYGHGCPAYPEVGCLPILKLGKI